MRSISTVPMHANQVIRLCVPSNWFRVGWDYNFSFTTMQRNNYTRYQTESIEINISIAPQTAIKFIVNGCIVRQQIK